MYVHACFSPALFLAQVQPIVDRMAQNPEIISKNFQISTRCTRILLGFIIYYLVLIVNPMGRILGRWKSFRNSLEMLCHPICNWLYICTWMCVYIERYDKQDSS